MKILNLMTFVPRFVPERLLTELSMYWVTSATATSGTYTTAGERRYKRMLWASNEFHKAHPEITSTGAYKDLHDMLSFDGIYRS